MSACRPGHPSSNETQAPEIIDLASELPNELVAKRKSTKQLSIAQRCMALSLLELFEIYWQNVRTKFRRVEQPNFHLSAIPIFVTVYVTI